MTARWTRFGFGCLHWTALTLDDLAALLGVEIEGEANPGLNRCPAH